MNTSNILKTSTEVLGLGNIAGDRYEADLPFQAQQYPLVLLQALSPQVIAGDPPDAKAGMFAGRLGEDQVLLADFAFLPIGFALTHPVFTPGQRTPIHDYGDRLPREAVFHLASEGYPRSGHFLPNGDQVVATITIYMLVDHGGRQQPSAYRFSHAAYPIGKQLGSRAAALRAVVDGERVRSCIVGKYSMTAVRETKNGKTYFVPRPTLLGVVGEHAGPTLAGVPLRG
jgi:hypothetical protein